MSPSLFFFFFWYIDSGCQFYRKVSCVQLLHHSFEKLNCNSNKNYSTSVLHEPHAQQAPSHLVSSWTTCHAFVKNPARIALCRDAAKVSCTVSFSCIIDISNMELTLAHTLAACAHLMNKCMVDSTLSEATECLKVANKPFSSPHFTKPANDTN